MKETEGHGGQIIEGNKNNYSQTIKLSTEVNKSRKLNEVVQRMLKVKQQQIQDKSTVTSLPNEEPYVTEVESDRPRQQIKMIDVQFATENKNSIPDRGFNEIKQGENLANFPLKTESDTATTPFITSTILALQKTQHDNSAFPTSIEDSPKSNSSAQKSNSVNSPSSSTTSGKDEDGECSQSPPLLSDDKSIRTAFAPPAHPTVCSLDTTQFSHYMNVASSTTHPIFSSAGVADVTSMTSLGMDKDAMYRTYHRELLKKMNPDVNEKRVSPVLPAEPTPTPGRHGRGKKSDNVVRNADGKPQYKRPPHTYPALIASAILDSPGNLITLRGIYDYIMNNFPYYKYCHDKSAWQNSIRHNLSLNQCFVKVPRYENAAKSNFWTMTHDGFEEFGNENSFKRRRRRGAALAPISAYKTKKFTSSTVEMENGKSGKHKQAIFPPANSGQRENGWPQQGIATTDQLYKRKANLIEDLKRTRSADDDSSVVKHPRMMILKQGDGPKIYKQNDPQARPNSLSSVEEMQGNVNSFSQTLSTAKEEPKSTKYVDQDEVAAYEARAAQQQWLMAAAAAQKNLLAGLSTNAASMAAAGMFPPYLVPSNVSPRLRTATRSNTPPEGKSPGSTENGISGFHEESTSVYLEDVEIGTKLSTSGDHESRPASYHCRFCDYKCVSDNASSLKQHSHILHIQEILRLRAEVNNQQQRRSPPHDTHSTKWTTSQSAGYTGVISESSPPSQTLLSGLYNEPMLRPFAHPGSNPSLEQFMASGAGQDISSSVQKQQLLALLHQAAVANNQGSQDQNMRQFLYQQMLLQNSLFASNQNLQSIHPNQGSESVDQSTLSKLLNYQKLLGESAKHDEQKAEDDVHPARENVPTQQTNGGSSSDDACEVDEARNVGISSENIHGWRKCSNCDFRAKGAHGLELHYRKVHSSSGTSENNTSPINGIESWKPEENVIRNVENISRKVSRDAYSDPGSCYQRPSTNCSTQTDQDRTRERTCQYCDVIFGDDMMHALHMSCHDKSHPYTCTICGQNCHEKYYFNVHLLRGLHSPNKSPKATQEVAINGEKEDKPTRRFSEQSDVGN